MRSVDRASSSRVVVPNSQPNRTCTSRGSRLLKSVLKIVVNVILELSPVNGCRNLDPARTAHGTQPSLPSPTRADQLPGHAVPRKKIPAEAGTFKKMRRSPTLALRLPSAVLA